MSLVTNLKAPLHKKWLAKFALEHKIVKRSWFKKAGFKWYTPIVGPAARKLIDKVRRHLSMPETGMFDAKLLREIRPKSKSVILYPNYHWNGPLITRGAFPTYVVVHNAAANGVTALEIDSWHKSRGFMGIGYHFYVRQDGTIYAGRPLGVVGAHTLGWNNEIGVCCEGNFDSQTSMSSVQLAALKWIISYIKSKYPTIKYVRGHKEMPGNATSCPGNHFPLSAVRE